MAILDQLLKGKKFSSSAKLTPENISTEILKQLIPIRNLSEEKLQAFALEKQSEVFAKGSVLFRAGETGNAVFYLLKGSVELTDDNGNSYQVDSDSAKAKFPLTSGARYTTTATAKTDVSILRVSYKIMTVDQGVFEKQKHLHIPDELSHSQLVQAFSQHYLDDDLEIPSMPNIAAKLRQAMQDDIGIAEAVEIIQLDPVISAKLVQVANCPLYVTVNPAKSCFDAVNRIGLNATRNLVISLSIKHVFNNDNPLIRKQLNLIWRQSIFNSSICFVLATLTKHVNPEEALLAGLVSDIGLVPFLNFAANLPNEYYTEKDLQIVQPYIRGPVGTNILRKWDFPEELVDIPLVAEDWYQSSEGELNLKDIVVLSRLHSKIGTPAMSELPAITSIPAASKLPDTSLSPENSLHILHDAKHKILETFKAFSI